MPDLEGPEEARRRGYRAYGRLARLLAELERRRLIARPREILIITGGS